MQALPDVLGPWHEFYSLVGTASATLIGLLFVAASVGSGIFSMNRPHTVRAFLSSSVVHFTFVLTACLVASAPIRQWAILGTLAAILGGAGLAYAGLVWRTMVRSGLTGNLDVWDRLLYGRIPVVGYVILAASGGVFFLHTTFACDMLAVAIGVLLLAGIRNAWDITIWAVTRRRDSIPD